jgi:hypothetical protein
VKILEHVAEVGWVLEAAAERDFFDLHVPFPKVGQIIVRAREPHAADIIADRFARTVKYLVQMMLGPCRGGAVRLGPSDDVLMVGEGIETCLAAMQASGRPA